jgi:hypothetical protein
MRSYHFLAILILMVFIAIPLVRADYYVSTDKSTYRIGEPITVYVRTDGGRLALVLEGPYTINVPLGDFPKGSYTFTIGETEARDVGSWTVTLRVETCAGYCLGYDSSNPPKAYFQVIAENVPEFPMPGTILPVLAVALVGTTILARRFHSSR